MESGPAGSTLHPDDSDLDEVLSALPQQEACIELFRINAQGGRPLYLEDVQPSIFNLAYVTGKFGGGRYLASAKYVSGERVKMPFEIEGEPIPVRRLKPECRCRTDSGSIERGPLASIVSTNPPGGGI